jgi:phytoene dehydrogenase-like protein
MAKSIVIIGAGIAGLSAGCYARMNGYSTTIVEMHNIPGGLCTAWKRNGYTFDACIHWLVGSKPGNDPMRQGWEELGAVQGKEIINHEIFMSMDNKEGKRFNFYEDMDRLEKEMIKIAPGDTTVIKKLVGDIKLLSEMPSGPPEKKPGEKGPGFFKSFAGFVGFLPTLFKIIGYGRITVAQLTKKFRSPLLRQYIKEVFYGLDDFTSLALIFTLAWMHSKNAGYPIGGSLEFAKSIEERYKKLGGDVIYNSAVEKVIVENGRAAGVQLKSGKEIRSDIVISAADGHATIYKLLEGKFRNSKIDRIYRTFKRFGSLIQVSIGVAMEFKGEPQTVIFPLEKTLNAGTVSIDSLGLRIYSFDRTMAPEGKTTVTAMFGADYEYWTLLRTSDKKKYEQEKKRIGEEVINAVDKKYPGFREKVEVIDVATPATYERYTGNWMASFEGWQLTPVSMMTKIPRTLPGLKDFYMIG